MLDPTAERTITLMGRLRVIALALGILGGICLALWQARQARLDADLIATIRGGEFAEATHLLEAGANPNASLWIGRGRSASTLPDALRFWLQGSRRTGTGYFLSALELALPAPFSFGTRFGRSRPGSPGRESGRASDSARARTSTQALGAESVANSTEARLPLVRALLAHGADPNLHRPGDSPLNAAVRMDDAETVELLLQHGADPNDDEWPGTTPLLMAQPRCARLLLKQ